MFQIFNETFNINQGGRNWIEIKKHFSVNDFFLTRMNSRSNWTPRLGHRSTNSPSVTQTQQFVVSNCLHSSSNATH